MLANLVIRKFALAVSVEPYRLNAKAVRLEPQMSTLVALVAVESTAFNEPSRTRNMFIDRRNPYALTGYLHCVEGNDDPRAEHDELVGTGGKNHSACLGPIGTKPFWA